MVQWIEPPVHRTVEAILLGLELGRLLSSVLADKVMSQSQQLVGALLPKVQDVSCGQFIMKLTVDCLAGRIVNPELPWSKYRPFCDVHASCESKHRVSHRGSDVASPATGEVVPSLHLNASHAATATPVVSTPLSMPSVAARAPCTTMVGMAESNVSATASEPATAPSHAVGSAAPPGTQLIVTGEGPTPAPPQSGESPSTTLATTIPRKQRHQDETRANNEEPEVKVPRLEQGNVRAGSPPEAPSVPKPTAPSRTAFLPSHTVGGPTAVSAPMDTDADDAGAMFMLLLIAFASLVWVMILSIFTAYYCALWRYNAQFPPSLLRINARYGAIMHNWCCV